MPAVAYSVEFSHNNHLYGLANTGGVNLPYTQLQGVNIINSVLQSLATIDLTTQ
jgi:hypothetical protein